MSDELKKLQSALQAARPKPDPAARARALEAAMAAFDAQKLDARAAAPVSAAPVSAAPVSADTVPWWQRLRARLAAKPALAFATSVTAVALVTVIVLPQDPPPAPVAQKAAPTSPPLAQSRAAAPAAAPAPVAPAPMEPASMAAEPVAAEFASDAASAFALNDEAAVVQAAEAPVATIAPELDRAAWPLLRQKLNAGLWPEARDIRIPEMLNYFSYGYAPPVEGAAFALDLSVMPSPWNGENQLVVIGLQGASPPVAERPGLNLVFVVDSAASMASPEKLPILRESLALVLPQLRPEDQLAIVAYGAGTRLLLPPTSARMTEEILAALDGLPQAGEARDGAALDLAYALADDMAAPGKIGRILLATDGDLNLGPEGAAADLDSLQAQISAESEAGIYLSVLGFGRGGLDAARMQALAASGNGIAGYIDSLSEAHALLSDHLKGALFPLADDVELEVEWNPDRVGSYRLLGHLGQDAQSDPALFAKGEPGKALGAGLQMTAIYELSAPKAEEAREGDPRMARSSGAAVDPAMIADELGIVRLRWRALGEDHLQLVEQPITGFEEGSDDTGFAVAIAGFGEWLLGGAALGKWGVAEAIELASQNLGEDPHGARHEALTLMHIAQSLSR